MSITQPNIANVTSLRPKATQGQGENNFFTFGSEDRQFPDNQAGFRTFSTTGWEAPFPSFLSTTSEIRMPQHGAPPTNEFQTFFHDKLPYEMGAYAPPALPTLRSKYKTESSGVPIQGPFNDNSIHLTNNLHLPIYEGWALDPYIAPQGPPGYGGGGGRRGGGGGGGGGGGSQPPSDPTEGTLEIGDDVDDDGTIDGDEKKDPSLQEWEEIMEREFKRMENEPEEDFEARKQAAIRKEKIRRLNAGKVRKRADPPINRRGGKRTSGRGGQGVGGYGGNLRIPTNFRNDGVVDDGDDDDDDGDESKVTVVRRVPSKTLPIGTKVVDQSSQERTREWEAKIADLEANYNSLIDEHASKISQSRKEYQDIMDQLHKTSSSAQDLAVKLDAQEGETKRLQTVIGDREQSILDLKAAIVGLEKAVSDKGGQVTAVDETKLKQLETELKQMEVDKAELNNKIEIINQEKQANVTSVNKLEEENRRLKAHMDTLGREDADLKQQLQEMVDKNKQALGELEKRKIDELSLRGQIDAYINQIRSMDAEHQLTIANLQNAGNAALRNVFENQERIKNLEGEIGRLNREVAGTKLEADEQARKKYEIGRELDNAMANQVQLKAAYDTVLAQGMNEKQKNKEARATLLAVRAEYEEKFRTMATEINQLNRNALLISAGTANIGGVTGTVGTPFVAMAIENVLEAKLPDATLDINMPVLFHDGLLQPPAPVVQDLTGDDDDDDDDDDVDMGGGGTITPFASIAGMGGGPPAGGGNADMTDYSQLPSLGRTPAQIEASKKLKAMGGPNFPNLLPGTDIDDGSNMESKTPEPSPPKIIRRPDITDLETAQEVHRHLLHIQDVYAQKSQLGEPIGGANLALNPADFINLSATLIRDMRGTLSNLMDTSDADVRAFGRVNIAYTVQRVSYQVLEVQNFLTNMYPHFAQDVPMMGVLHSFLEDVNTFVISTLSRFNQVSPNAFQDVERLESVAGVENYHSLLQLITAQTFDFMTEDVAYQAKTGRFGIGLIDMTRADDDEKMVLTTKEVINLTKSDDEGVIIVSDDDAVGDSIQTKREKMARAGVGVGGHIPPAPPVKRKDLNSKDNPINLAETPFANAVMAVAAANSNNVYSAEPQPFFMVNDAKGQEPGPVESLFPPRLEDDTGRYADGTGRTAAAAAYGGFGTDGTSAQTEAPVTRGSSRSGGTFNNGGLNSNGGTRSMLGSVGDAAKAFFSAPKGKKTPASSDEEVVITGEKLTKAGKKDRNRQRAKKE